MSTSLSRRRFLGVSAGAVAATVALSACSATPAAEVQETAVQTPEEAITRLKEGNARYVSNKLSEPHRSADWRGSLASGQHPFATVFSCVDSRVPPELVFDRGLGDLFVIRTAAHVIDTAVLGSIEFGVAELKIPLIVVMGHQSCGAVKATVEAVESNTTAPADIASLVAYISPSVEESEGQGGDVLALAVDANVKHTVEKLRATAIISDAVAAGTVQVVAARYNLDTGTVTWLDA